MHPALTAVAALGAAFVGALPVTPAGSANKIVYITFDDGPSSSYTSRILDILSQNGAHATFFELGQNVARFPSLTRQANLQGNSVQSHSWSHPDLRSLS